MRKLLIARLLFGAGLLGAVVFAAAAQGTGSILVDNAWARATTPNAQAAAIYVTVTDHGAPDRLVGVSTPVAGKAQLHETIHDGNVMKMRPVEGLAISAGAPISLSPGGYHIMLTELSRPLASGETFPLSLRFEKAGTVETTVTVRAPGGGAAMNMGGGAAMNTGGGAAMGKAGGAAMDMGGGAAMNTGGGHDMQHMNMPGGNKP